MVQKVTPELFSYRCLNWYSMIWSDLKLQIYVAESFRNLKKLSNLIETVRGKNSTGKRFLRRFFSRLFLLFPWSAPRSPSMRIYKLNVVRFTKILADLKLTSYFYWVNCPSKNERNQFSSVTKFWPDILQENCRFSLKLNPISHQISTKLNRLFFQIEFFALCIPWIRRLDFSATGTLVL